MAEARSLSAWRYWIVFLLLSLAVIFFQLLPVGGGIGGLPGPDLLLCLSIAWVLRRPTCVPVLLIAAITLLTDVLFLRPLGAWTLVVVLGTEFLRARAPDFREIPFPIEWMIVAVMIALMTIGYLLLLAVFLAGGPALGLTLLQMMATILAYPLVVGFSAGVVGLRKLRPGDVDALGRKL